MISYGGVDGPAYLDIKDNEQAHKIFLNFVRSVVGYVGEDAFEGTEYQKIKAALADYNAVYKFSQGKNGHIKRHFIRFGTPKDLTAFLMRYS